MLYSVWLQYSDSKFYYHDHCTLLNVDVYNYMLYSQTMVNWLLVALCQDIFRNSLCELACQQVQGSRFSQAKKVKIEEKTQDRPEYIDIATNNRLKNAQITNNNLIINSLLLFYIKNPNKIQHKYIIKNPLYPYIIHAMSFLFNMFSRNSRQQLSKYDKITFKINLSDHIPQYYQSTSNKAITQTQITPDHPLYYEIFPKTTSQQQQQKSDQFVEYTAKVTDTMFGIALNLDLSQQYLRNVNGISGSLYPGMVIKLPKGVDLKKLEDGAGTENTERLRISQLLNSDKPATTVNYKYTVNYLAGPSGQIKGSLTINTNYIIFNPLLDDQSNITRFTIQKLLKFNVLIQMSDIQKAQYLSMPQMQTNSEEYQPKINHIIQFMLYKVGNQKIEKKYKDRLKELKINNKAIASISFSILQTQSTDKQINLDKQCVQIADNVNQMIKNQVPEEDQDNKKRLTNIPFFDIINDKTLGPSAVKQQPTHILSQDSYLGSLTEESNILTPAHFQNLVKKFPILYRLYNWTKVFSARKDGSAFNTFMSKTKDVEPAIILIKQYKGNILGAFLIQSIEVGKTGRGEMFIFTFRGQSKDPEVYMWTTKNDFFVYLQKQQGLGIGMGIKYGIFMNRNLEKGSSAATKTFGNTQPLSANQDFHIDDVEVWGVDNSF